MTYNLGIPAASNTPAHDQPLMQQNFGQIATSYNTDHIPLNSGSNAGYSNKLTLVTQSIAPTKVAGAGINYSLVPTNYVTTHTELFYEGEAGTGSIQQITNQTLTTASGEGMLPGGLQIRAGNGTTANPIVFTHAFPTAIISAVATTQGSPIQVNISAASTSGITVASASGVVAFYYIAIGY